MTLVRKGAPPVSAGAFSSPDRAPSRVALDRDDVLELLEAAHDPGELRDRGDLERGLTTAVWSGETWTPAATMLTLLSATTWLMSDSRPGPVVRLDADRDRVGLLRLGLPFDLDQAR